MPRTRKTIGTVGTTPSRPPYVLAEIDPTGQTYRIAKAQNFLDLKPGEVVDLNKLRCLTNSGINVVVQLPPPEDKPA